jgi:hypothetical protein
MRRIFIAFALAVSCATVSGCAAEAASEGKSAPSPLSADGQRARDGLEQAKSARDEQNASLARQMSQIGKTLTEDQQRTYAQAFEALPQVQATTTIFEVSAAALDHELRSIMTNPATLASTLLAPWDDGGMYDSVKLLVDTRYAPTALLFAAHVIGGDPAYRNLGVSKDQVINDIVIPALPAALASLIVQYGGADEAIAQLKEILSSAQEQCSQLIDAIETFQDLTGASDLNPDAVKIGDTSVGKAVSAAGAVLAFWDVADGVSDLARGNARKALEEFATGGPASVEALAQATGAFRRIMFGIEKTPLANRVVAIASKVGAAVAVVASILQTFDDLKQWNASDDAKVRVLSDIVSVGAAALTLVGFATGGVVLGFVAIGIMLFADFLQDQRLSAEDLQEKTACLAKVFPYDPLLAQTLVKADPAEVQELSDTLGMSPSAIQSVALMYPNGLTDEQFPAMPARWIGLEVMQSIFSLKGDAFATVIQKVANGEPDTLRRNFKVHFFLAYLAIASDWDASMITSKADAVSWLRNQANSDTFQLYSDGFDQGEWTRIVNDVAGFLQTQ